MKSIYSSIILIMFAVLIFASATAAQTPVEKSSGVLTGSKITGAWRVNYAESDNPILKMQTFLQSKIASSPNKKNADAQNDALPTMSISLVPPETLILAGDETSITINEGFSEIVFTRTFMTDGKTRSGEFLGGTFFSITAMQDSDFLKLETVSPRGNKMLETYAISADGKKLMVTVRFETAGAKEILTLRRVYDRAIPDIFPDGAETIQ